MNNWIDNVKIMNPCCSSGLKVQWELPVSLDAIIAYTIKHFDRIDPVTQNGNKYEKVYQDVQVPKAKKFS